MTAPSSLARLRPALWFGSLVLLIISVAHALTATALFRQQPLLPYGLTLDLLVGIPALFYWLVVRRYALPNSTLFGMVGACLALAYVLLPVAQQAPLRALYFLPALLEGITLLVLVAKGRRLVQCYRVAYRQQPHFWPCAQLAVRQTLGRAGVLLLAEVEMLRYAVLGWGGRSKAPRRPGPSAPTGTRALRPWSSRPGLLWSWKPRPWTCCCGCGAPAWRAGFCLWRAHAAAARGARARRPVTAGPAHGRHPAAQRRRCVAPDRAPRRASGARAVTGLPQTSR